jgi:hypothetical protein
LESAVWDARRANKHHVLAIGLPQFLHYKWPRWDAHVTWVFCMPYHEGRVKDSDNPSALCFKTSLLRVLSYQNM